MARFRLGGFMYNFNSSTIMNEHSDVYYIPTERGEGIYKEKGSKFFAYLFPVYTVSEVEESLLELKKLHPKSRHICYAYRLAPKDQQFRINDDGEPSGTAGKPIFNQILSANVHNCLIAVVRYFGGTKLGASGLIRAYKISAEESIKTIQIVEKYETTSCKLLFEYARMGDLMDSLKQLNIEILEKAFDENPYLIIGLRSSIAKQQIRALKAHLLKRDIQDIEDDTQVEQINIEDDHLE